jgi:hypothetical protein
MKSKIVLVLRWIVAAILLQTLFFKFTGSSESIYIFSKVGAEPWGRWFAGATELVAGVLLVLPSTYLFGALMSLGVIAGALMSHLLILGIVVQNDGGLLFGLACVVFTLSLAILILCQDQLWAAIQHGQVLLRSKRN